MARSTCTKTNLSTRWCQLSWNWDPDEVAAVGDGCELSKDASVAGADSCEADVSDRLQTPVELRPLVVGEVGGTVAE